MSYSISHSERSQSDFHLILDYLDEEWGEKTSENFINKVEKVLLAISDSPEMFACISRKKRIHRCLINHRVLLYYKISDNEIELITFFQTRQHPGKLKF